MTTFDVAQFRTHCLASIRNGSSFFARRTIQSRSAYSTRAFYHELPPHSQNDPPAIVHKSASEIVVWVDHLNAHVPMRNREMSQAAWEGMQYFGLDPLAEGDALRFVFIKSYKAASSTMSSILARIAFARGMSVPITMKDSRFIKITASEPQNRAQFYDAILHHNHHAGNIQLGNGAFELRQGYQPWMDFHIPRAWRLITVADPCAVCFCNLGRTRFSITSCNRI